MSAAANHRSETRLEFQISPTYSKTSVPSAEKKKECEKTCLELPSAREYSTISRAGIRWIHYSLWIIRPDLTAIVQWAFKYCDEEPLQTWKVYVTVPMYEYGCAPVLQESLGTINVW